MGATTTGSQTSGTHRGARLVLALGVLAGLFYLVHKLRTEFWMVGLDFRVYRGAAVAALSGDPIYGTSPIDIPGMTFRYPPVVLLAFLPTVLVPWQVGYVLHTSLVIGAGLALTALIDAILAERGVDLEWLDRALIAAFVLGSADAMPSLVFGQVNHFVALALATGFVWLDRGSEIRSGSALALAALPKVFPAAVGLWLLRQRAHRAVASALATGLGSLALGLVVVGPASSRRWLTEELIPRMRSDLFAGGLPASSHLVTVRRPLSVAFPAADPSLYGIGAFLLLAPIAGYLLWDRGRPLSRPVALFGLLASILLFFPSSYLYLIYLYVPFIPLLYLLDGPGRSLFLAGGVLVNLPLQYDDFVTAASAVPPGETVDSVLLSVLEPLFTFGTPVLYGLGLSLAGCVVWQARGDETAATETAGS